MRARSSVGVAAASPMRLPSARPLEDSVRLAEKRGLVASVSGTPRQRPLSVPKQRPPRRPPQPTGPGRPQPGKPAKLTGCKAATSLLRRPPTAGPGPTGPGRPPPQIVWKPAKSSGCGAAPSGPPLSTGCPSNAPGCNAATTPLPPSRPPKSAHAWNGRLRRPNATAQVKVKATALEPRAVRPPNSASLRPLSFGAPKAPAAQSLLKRRADSPLPSQDTPAWIHAANARLAKKPQLQQLPRQLAAPGSSFQAARPQASPRPAPPSRKRAKTLLLRPDSPAARGLIALSGLPS